MKKGFTLIEMLVVIGIISVLLGASVVSFSKMRKSADRAKANELVSNVATALTQIFNDKGFWPKTIRNGNNSSTGMDATIISAMTAAGSIMKFDTKGIDRLGIVSPWAAAVLKRKGSSASLSDKVDTGGTIQDHILYYAVDLDGDGIVEAEVGGSKVNIRATAAVWCAGKDGKLQTYTDGLKSDDAYSWPKGKTVNAK